MAKFLLDCINYIPIVGHIKGLIQVLYGDKEAAERAYLAATRTTAILAAGAGGFLLGGPPAAAICGTIVGIQWDLGAIISTHGKLIEGISKVIEEPTNLHAWVEGTVRVAGDGITGVCGGKLGEVAKSTKLFAVQPERRRAPSPAALKALMYQSETDSDLIPQLENTDITHSLAYLDLNQIRS